jgi:hypothetical protein
MSNKVRSATAPDTLAGAIHDSRAQRTRVPESQVESERRELSHRSNGGIDVTLYWHPTLDELTVCVRDQRHGAHFEIRAQRDLARDVYNHPYAYAEFAHLPAEGVH